MSQNLSAVAILLMVISPVLIPAIVTIAHRASVSLRDVVDRRRTEPAAALA
jgi:hypothetical protein